MKKIAAALALSFGLVTLSNAIVNNNLGSITAINGDKIDIKIKNDSGDEVTVYNAGSGGTYRLAKNTTTTIKMEAGDKLYYYEGGKKANYY